MSRIIVLFGLDTDHFRKVTKMRNNYFKVGTFNLYNLALAGKKYYNRSYTQDQYDRKTAWISAQLGRMDADIVGFQEVFHTEALHDVLAKNDKYYDANIRVAGGTGEGPSVGLVSRYPVTDFEAIPHFPESARLDFDGVAFPLDSFSRPVLKAKVELNSDLEIVVFVVHFKSKRPKVSRDADPHDPAERALGHARSLMIRAAETTALRHILLDTMKGTRRAVIVIGDFNDDGGAVTSKIISGSPPWRKLHIEQKRRIWDVLLYNVKDIQARQSYRDVYYTHLHNGHHDSLDHILVSEELVRQNRNRVGHVEYVKVFNDHLIDETLSPDKVPVWHSDHGQVVATIQLDGRRQSR